LKNIQLRGWVFFFLMSFAPVSNQRDEFKLLPQKDFWPDLEVAGQAAGVLGGKRPLATSQPADLRLGYACRLAEI
jgi:hypothetical protein